MITNLEKATRLAGGVTAVAKACGVSRQAVHNWIKDGELPKQTRHLHAGLISHSCYGLVTEDELMGCS